MTKLKARPARVKVVRQHAVRDTDQPRTQLHTHVSERLSEMWGKHFDGEYAIHSTGVELGMQVILYLTNAPEIDAVTLVSRLCKTYPDVRETLESNAFALAEAFRGVGEPTQ